MGSPLAFAAVRNTIDRPALSKNLGLIMPSKELLHVLVLISITNRHMLIFQGFMVLTL